MAKIKVRGVLTATSPPMECNSLQGKAPFEGVENSERVHALKSNSSTPTTAPKLISLMQEIPVKDSKKVGNTQNTNVDHAALPNLTTNTSTPTRLSLITSSPVVVNGQVACNRSPSDLAPLRTSLESSANINIRPSKLGAHQSRKRKCTVVSFKDKYVLTGRELGKGSTASVSTCIDMLTGVEYAVKICAKSHRDERQSKRIHREIETFKLTNGHPNVCRLIEFFQDSTMYYSIFEKMEGGSLLNQIEKKMVFTEAEASLVTRDVACALEFLHSLGIAHRDLKPENVLCKYSHTMVPVKISDFDLASDSHLNGSPTYPIHTPELTTPVGSAEFMAPEVVKTYNGEAHHYDKRCDMWSLGVIIYIMHCGYPPFYGQCGAVDCGWVRGGFCQGCQDMLFQRIQKGHFDFPDPDWTHISLAAKDLISRLLIKDSRKRFTPSDVLKHDWVKYPAPSTVLETPDVLKRTNSAGSLTKFTQNAMAVNRMIQQCYAIHQDILDTGGVNGLPFSPSTIDPLPHKDKHSPGGGRKSETSCSEEDEETPFGSCVDQSGTFFVGTRPLRMPGSPIPPNDRLKSPVVTTNYGYTACTAPYFNFNGFYNCFSQQPSFPDPRFCCTTPFNSPLPTKIGEKSKKVSPLCVPNPYVAAPLYTPTEIVVTEPGSTDESSFYLAALHFEEGLKERRASVEELEENRDKITAKLRGLDVDDQKPACNNEVKVNILGRTAKPQNDVPYNLALKMSTGISNAPTLHQGPDTRLGSDRSLDNSLNSAENFGNGFNGIGAPPQLYDKYIGARLPTVDHSIPHLALILNERLRDLTHHHHKKAAH